MKKGREYCCFSGCPDCDFGKQMNPESTMTTEDHECCCDEHEEFSQIESGPIMKKVCVPLGNGFEEIEAITLIDVLRRGGLEVIIAGVGSKQLKGGHGISVQADVLFDEIINVDFDMILLPGGMGGTEVLCADHGVQSKIKKMSQSKKYIGAICAAPMALAKANVLNKEFTCYPSVEVKTSSTRLDKNVVIDGNIMTSRGPATAMEFALEIVKTLVGEKKYQEVKSGLLF